MTHVSYMSGCLEMRETSNIHNSKLLWFGWTPLSYWHGRPFEKKHVELITVAISRNKNEIDNIFDAVILKSFLTL